MKVPRCSQPKGITGMCVFGTVLVKLRPGANRHIGKWVSGLPRVWGAEVTGLPNKLRDQRGRKCAIDRYVV